MVICGLCCNIISFIVGNMELLESSEVLTSTCVRFQFMFTGQLAGMDQMGMHVDVTHPVPSMGTAVSTLHHLSPNSSDLELPSSPAVIQVCI
jgi:CheY-specific phosphatase CheX